jgi:A/G-specific adenine glycosylase
VPRDEGSFAARLLAWFDRERRDLPWRRTCDPWAIWVSEVMLQQTRVEAVREAFDRFVRRFPAPADFARAGDDELLTAWRGLGYYRRARLLRDGAREVVVRHGGRVPAEREALAALPGIGPYTLGALGSIAFGHAEPAIDGNVERVVARHRGIRDNPRSSNGRRAIRAVVDEWMDRRRPGDFNQALMELGALACTPAGADCQRCPVAADCVAQREGLVDELPVRSKPRPPVPVVARVALAIDGAQALAARIGEGEPNAGQIELPGPGILTSVDEADLAAVLRERFGAGIDVGPVVASARHAITHHRIVVHAHLAQVREPGRLRWFPLDTATPWTTPSRKVFAKALGTGGDLRA